MDTYCLYKVNLYVYVIIIKVIKEDLSTIITRCKTVHFVNTILSKHSFHFRLNSA